jgi:hypothetical protein
MTEKGDNEVSIKDYVDARLQDLRLMHERDLKNQQDEIDRRIEAAGREMNYRFGQADERMDRMDVTHRARQDLVESQVDDIQGQLNRQRGRMAAYATVTGILLLLLTVFGLVLDHVRL